MLIDVKVLLIISSSLLCVTADTQKHLLLETLLGGVETIPRDLISKIERLIVPTLKTSSNSLCKAHSDIYIQGLQNGTSWAYQMLDSSAKLQAGILVGNFISMGNFDECIAVSGIRTDSGTFGGKHCMTTFTWKNDTTLSTSGFFRNMKRPGVETLTLKWGICIPSTCGPQDLATGLKYFLPEDVDVSVADLDCHTGDRKEFKTIDYVAIAIFSVIGILVLLSTSYDMFKKGRRKEILLSFSLYTNGKKLLNTESSTDTLPALHGIRFLSMCWIVIGHRYMISTGGPAINLVFSNKFITSWDSTFVVNSALAVDTFLLMSGLLIVYILLGQTEKQQKKSFNIPLYYLHRYIRLTPVLAVMVLLQLSLIEHMGSGPLWDTNNSFLTQLCKENWWSALLYVQNYVSGDRMCVGHSWYLSVDMQLVWMSPLILIPLLRWPRKWGYVLLGTLTLAGILTAFTVSFVNEFPAGIRAGEGPKWNAKDKYEYVPTHTRFTPWVIGIGLGYFLYHNKNKKVELNKIQVYSGWLISSVALLSSVYAILPFQQPDYPYNALQSSAYTSLHRSIWSFAVGWVIFACVTGYGGPVNKFLSWKAFQPFSRLTYCIYLVHFTFIIYRQFAIRTPVYLNDMNVVSYFFSDMIFSILLAALLSLVFESPAITIEKILLRRNGRLHRNPKASNITTNMSVEEGKVNKAFSIKINDNSKLNNG